jgi:integrative and conjugative element protein (TIGR02256 family)
MKLVYRVSPSQRVIFTASAVQQMSRHRQCSLWRFEAGGALLGRHLLESDDMVVDEVTTPLAADLRSRFRFFRSKQHDQVARQRWTDEQSTMAYLGLWHTHPEDDPSPSVVDKADWRRAVERDAFHGDRLFFPIVGIERLRVWSLSRGGEIEELELEERVSQR